MIRIAADATEGARWPRGVTIRVVHMIQHGSDRERILFEREPRARDAFKVSSFDAIAPCMTLDDSARLVSVAAA